MRMLLQRKGARRRTRTTTVRDRRADALPPGGSQGRCGEFADAKGVHQRTRSVRDVQEGPVIGMEYGITVYPPRTPAATVVRFGTRMASGGSASLSGRRGSTRSWRRSPNGWRRTRQT